MKVAKSMYLGGIEVWANQIKGYEDYKNLGLTCHYCGEAVFWRSHSEYKIASNKVVRRASCFAHYESDCECEVKYSAVRQVYPHLLPQLKESKNQRLKLYNLYLWEIIVSSIEINIKLMNKITKVVGRKKLDEIVEKLEKVWVKKLKMLPNLVNGLEEAYVDKKINEVDLPLEARLAVNKDADYFNSKTFNRYIHRSICTEVIMYLGTYTGRYVLKKLLKQVIVAEIIVLTNEGKEPNIGGDSVIKVALMALFTTAWIPEIEKRLNN